MGALNLVRSIPSYLDTSIGLKGVREDDEFLMDVFQERKKNYRLKRTYYKIKTGSKFDFNFLNTEIQLPVFNSLNEEFELKLIPHDLSKNLDSKARYIFKSLTNTPFKINGIFSFECFLERGDIIEIGFNRIQFLKPLCLIKNSIESEIQISKEVISGNISILLEGETGTGKTTLAKKIHDESGRVGRFVHINLSSFSVNLIESELFGHVKGAFTGAINDKRGAILEANKGTLFLDEIDSLSLELQTKLLLFLDGHEFRAVGGSSNLKSDVRLIFASGSKLQKLVEQKIMRKDFYYRLTSGFVYYLKSLRENTEKIKSICLEFEQENFITINQELVSFYQECPWPGNFRQLRSHLLKKKMLSNGKKINISNEDYELLNSKDQLEVVECNQIKKLEEIKMDYCLNAFIKMDKNYVKCAKILDISPNTLKAMLLNRSKKQLDDQ